MKRNEMKMKGAFVSEGEKENHFRRRIKKFSPSSMAEIKARPKHQQSQEDESLSHCSRCLCALFAVHVSGGWTSHQHFNIVGDKIFESRPIVKNGEREGKRGSLSCSLVPMELFYFVPASALKRNSLPQHRSTE